MDSISKKEEIVPYSRLKDLSFQRKLPGLIQQVMSFPDGEILINKMNSKAVLQEHAHIEYQFGFALENSFTLTAGIDNQSYTIDYSTAYLLNKNIPHRAEQMSEHSVYTIDIKWSTKCSGLTDNEIITLLPLIEEYNWGKINSYYVNKALLCHHIYIKPYSKTHINTLNGNYYIVIKDLNKSNIGSISKLEFPVYLEGGKKGLHAVIIKTCDHK